MIKVNLLTEKKGKNPLAGITDFIFPAIILIIAIAACGAGWFALEQKLDNDYKLQEEEKANEKRIKDENEEQVKKRENLKKRLLNIKNDIDKLKRLSGLNLVQWSDTMNLLTSLVPEKLVWITNLRVDSDRRVQITAYSCGDQNKDKKSSSSPQVKNNAGEGNLSQGIQNFINNLMGQEYFEQVFLTNATKNVYEKKPVWRFEINCRLARDKSNKKPED